MQGKKADRFFVLDFDRCLADTELLFYLYDQAMYKAGQLTPQQLARERQAAEARGESFDVLGRVNQLIDKPTRQTVDQLFIKEARRQSDVLNPGARELLDTLERTGMPYGIVTYGGIEWQELKLQAAGLIDVSYIVVPEKGKKGKLIATWWDGTSFLVPSELGGVTVNCVVMVDDKPMEFYGLPDKARGYVVRPTDKERLPAQQGLVPSQVRSISSLYEVITSEGL